MLKKSSNSMVMITCLVIGSASGDWLFTNKRLTNLAENKSQLAKPSELIKFADSIRNSDPDTAIYYYHTINSILEQSKRGKSRDYLLALSHTGLAYADAEKGNNNISLSEIEAGKERSPGTIVKIQVPYDFCYTT